MNPKVLHMAPKNDHMEYSMWHEIVTTWSTPYDIKKQPYGVLHVAVGIDLFAGSLSTPYGTKNQPCGVLHMA